MIAAPWWMAGVLLLGAAHGAAAQAPAPALQPHHVIVAVGPMTSAGYAIGDRTAELRRNSTGAPSPFTLFRARSEIDHVTGVEARVAVALTRILSVEVGGGLASPPLNVAISQDAEGDPTPRVAETISQYTVEVGGVVLLPSLALGSRAVPFVMGGAGYLRQLHQDRVLVETGRLTYVGGGVQVWLRGASRPGRPLGIRADVRYVRRTGGIDFDDRSRSYPVVSVLGFVGF